MALVEGRYLKGDMTDKRFEADGLAAYCRRFLSSGVWELGNNLKVYSGNGMKINIDYGYALINGYLFGVVNNGTGPLQLTVEKADSQPRIDRVVGIADKNTQRVYAYIKKGTEAVNPQAPILAADEISLARINIAAGASVIMSGDIIDERINDTVCGLVNIVDPFLDSLKQNLRFWISPVSTSPATFLPGTWTRVTDTFIYAATDSGTYAVGQIGGEKEHVHGAINQKNGTLAAAIGATHNNPSVIGYLIESSNWVGTGGQSIYSVVGTNIGSGSFNHWTAIYGQTALASNMPTWKSFYMWERTDI